MESEYTLADVATTLECINAILIRGANPILIKRRVWDFALLLPVRSNSTVADIQIEMA
jgi:hypothetical protein